MKIDLEVLASTNIKRKKPWPNIIWIGEEQESLLLLDPVGKRISVLYVPSGKTKRRLAKLSPIAEQLVYVSRSKNGRYLVGILQNGEIFVWHKDKDVLKFISGLSKLAPHFTQEKCHIILSDDCTHMFVAVGNHHYFLWVMEKGESASRDHSDTGLKGGWHKIAVPEGIALPTSESREHSVAGVYYESPVLGRCMQYSVVYNRPSLLSIATLVMKFPDPAESFGKNLPVFTAEWSLLEYPFEQMHPSFEPINTPGAYVSSYSSSGQVLGIAANQRALSQTTMLFVSPLTDTVLVGDMKHCGVSDTSKTGRQYWVCDISWTSDSLFLACMLNNGSVCLIPRLGEPCIIQSQGNSVDMGPSYFLPLHPAVFVSDNQESLEPSAMELDPMQQKFSLATHPSLPIILFTDGFLVTVVQLPVDMTPVTLMRDLVVSSAKHLKKVYEQENLDMTVADAYKLSKGGKHNVAEQRKHRRQYEFEMAEVSLNASHESETSLIETSHKFGFDQFGAIGNMDAGKIVFGEPEMISIDPNATFSGLDATDALLKYLENAMADLTQAWKLAVSHADIWTAEVDNIAKQTVHNLSKIFSIVLDCPAVEAIIPALTPRQSSAIQNTRVYNVIIAYRNVLQLLRFDTYNQHLLPATLRLVHKTITLMLTSKQLETTDPRIKTLFGSYSLLKHAESSLNRTYVWVPSQNEGSIPSSEGSPRRFEPAMMVKIQNQSAGSDVTGVRLDQQGQLPGKRLATTWKFLYKQVMEYQSKVSGMGDPKGELSHVEKLMFTIQQTLQEADINITPRRASARLSSVWLRNAFPFDLLSDSDSFLYSEDTLQSSPLPGSSRSPSSTPVSGQTSSKGSPYSHLSLSPDHGLDNGNQNQPQNLHNQSDNLANKIEDDDNEVEVQNITSDIKGQTEGQTESPSRSLLGQKDVVITAYTSSSSSPNSAGASPSDAIRDSPSNVGDSPSNIGDSPSNVGDSPSKFNLFGRLKAAIKGRQSDMSGTGSGIHVGSYTSSDKGQSSSLTSFLSSRSRSTPRVLTYSSSVSSPKGDNSTLRAGLQTSLQVIDILRLADTDLKKDQNVESKQDDHDPLKSEGFEILGETTPSNDTIDISGMSVDIHRSDRSGDKVEKSHILHTHPDSNSGESGMRDENLMVVGKMENPNMDMGKNNEIKDTRNDSQSRDLKKRNPIKKISVSKESDNQENKGKIKYEKPDKQFKYYSKTVTKFWQCDIAWQKGKHNNEHCTR